MNKIILPVITLGAIYIYFLYQYDSDKNLVENKTSLTLATTIFEEQSQDMSFQGTITERKINSAVNYASTTRPHVDVIETEIEISTISFPTPDFDLLVATKVLSSYQRNQLDLYWDQQLDKNPENVWYELSNQPLLVNTMSSANIKKLFNVFSNELFMASFLNFENLNHIQQEKQFQISELLITLDPEYMVSRILELDEGLPIREVGLYSLGYSWVSNERSGEAFLDYIYQIDDDQLNDIMLENMHNFDFNDFEQQLEWIYFYDSKGLFASNVDELIKKAIKSGDSEVIDRILNLSSYSQRVKELALEVE